MEKPEKQLIFDALSKEPMGMTIQDLTRHTKLNRFTTTMFIHELIGEGRIVERKIGAYRLFKIKG